MTPAVLAFTLDLQSRIKTYGAYAGFAAVIGLAVLAILYFAQAREVKRLREWAGRGPERAADISARVGAEASKRVVAEPIARPEPVTAAALSAPPPSIATPATAAAQDVAGAVATPQTVAGAPGDAIPAVVAGAPAANGPVMPVPDATLAGTADAGPGVGAGDTDDVGGVSVTMAPIPASARLRASATPPPTARRPRADEADEHSPWRARLLIGGAVLVVAIVAVIIATSLGGSSKPKPNKVANTRTPTAVTSTTSTKGDSTKPAGPRKSISIGVLNGTTVPGLAKRIGAKLSGAGFTVPPKSETNARDQTHSATIVAYASGQFSAALEVAKTLNLARDALTPLDPDTSVVAGQGLTVVVTVGADLHS